MMTSCAVIRPEKPVEEYAQTVAPMETSVINIPVEFRVSDLEKMLNNQLKGLLYEDNSLDDNGGDNLMVKAWKKEDITISLQDNVLSYRVPLKLWIKAGWKVSQFGLSLSDYREINAEIALKFKTSITFNPDWTITTNTTSDGYDWLSSPVVKIGPVDVPIKYLADIILKSNQKTINKSIDDAISKNLGIKKEIQDIWLSVQKPVKVNDEYNVWIRVTPQQVFSTPLSGKAGILRHTIGIKSVTEAFVGKEPAFSPVKEVPKLSITNQVGNDFLINLGTEISTGKVNELARQYLQGQTFTQGKYHLLINNIDVYGSGNKLIIHLNVVGSLKGDLYFTGIPVFNDSTYSIGVKDLDFELRTKNALAKTGSWLFHGTLTKMIQKNMVFPIKDELKSAQALIEESMKEYKLTDNIYLNGSVDELSLGEITLTKEAIKALVLLKGKVVIKMK